MKNLIKTFLITPIFLLCFFAFPQDAAGLTLGYTNAGVTSGSLGCSYMIWSTLNPTASVNGNVDSVSFSGYGGTANFKGIILNSSEQIITNGVSSGQAASASKDWNTVLYGTKPSVISGNDFYPGIVNDNSISIYRDSGNLGDSKYETDNNYTNPTNPSFPSSSLYKYSIYCTYTAGGAAERRMFLVE